MNEGIHGDCRSSLRRSWRVGMCPLPSLQRTDSFNKLQLLCVPELHALVQARVGGALLFPRPVSALISHLSLSHSVLQVLWFFLFLF